MPHVNHRRETVQQARRRTCYGRHRHPSVTEYKHEFRRNYRRQMDWKLRDAIQAEDTEDLWFPKYLNAVSDFWFWD